MFYKHYTDLMCSGRVVPWKVLIHGIFFQTSNLTPASKWKASCEASNNLNAEILKVIFMIYLQRDQGCKITFKSTTEIK